MADDIVLKEIDARGVATLRLNRPEVNNAYNGDMIEMLSDHVGALTGDDAVRMIVIRGNGNHFQAGADLNWIQECREAGLETNLEVSRQTRDMFFRLTACPKPTIALVHGGCFGGGTGIVAACDIVVAEETAIFAITEARWGLVPTMIMPQLLSRLGPARARRYALSCERFDAGRAFEIGFVDEVCAPGGLDETAEPIIDSILHCPPATLAAVKADILHFSGLEFDAGTLDEMAQAHARLRFTDEADEGVKSFLEKRKPRWYPDI
ncbi:MAG: enoyl-CoA hydratase-related protein [Hyphomicrobiales bacterium]|nr:enoyl-CoA hydratase-related protein [Hyphomicrobiales bacterium]